MRMHRWVTALLVGGMSALSAGCKSDNPAAGDGSTASDSSVTVYDRGARDLGFVDQRVGDQSVADALPSPDEGAPSSDSAVNPDRGPASDGPRRDGPRPDAGRRDTGVARDVYRPDAPPPPPEVLWTRQHNGAVDGNDFATGVATDTANAIYVAGRETANAQGTNIWVAKYDTAGTLQWTKTENGSSNGDDAAMAVTHDRAGKMIVSGFLAQAPAVGRQHWTRKYDAAGATVWTIGPSGTAGEDLDRGVATDRLGQPVIVGQQNGSIWMAKYTTAGAPIAGWTDSGNGDNLLFGVDTDGTDAAIVVGRARAATAPNPWRIWTRKYAADRTIAWTNQYNDTPNQEGYAVATDSANNVILVGYDTGAGQGTNVWVRKLDPAGNTIWTQSYNGAANGNDAATCVAVDAQDNIIVGGYETVANQSLNGWLRKYTKANPPVVTWTRTINGGANNDDRWHGVTTDSANNIIAVGRITVVGQGTNVIVRKYSP
ncbi:MAG: hypothetical protein IT371_29600 [Deltaproteobacteria bacterium]|nr:hypothetical protein [Deltaproteobacteria bacterium]